MSVRKNSTETVLQCDSHSHTYTDVCMISAVAETISHSHRKVKTKSAGQAECRKEGSELCVGGAIEPRGVLNSGLHVCCMTDCLSICICSISLPSPSASRPPRSLLCVEAGKEQWQGNNHLWLARPAHGHTSHHIQIQGKAQYSMAWHGTAKQTNNKQLLLKSRQQEENYRFCSESTCLNDWRLHPLQCLLLQIRITGKSLTHQKQCRK